MGFINYLTSPFNGVPTLPRNLDPEMPLFALGASSGGAARDKIVDDIGLFFLGWNGEVKMGDLWQI